jgi:serine/threonine protein kinase
VTSLDAALPPELDQILARAMAKEPSQRYQSAAEMAQAIEEFRRQHQLLTTGTSSSLWFAGTTDYSTAAAALDKQPLPATGTPKKPQPRLSIRHLVYAGCALLLLAISGGLIATKFRQPTPAVAALVTAPSQPSPVISRPASAPPAKADATLPQSKPAPVRKAPSVVSARLHASSATLQPATPATSIMQVEIDHPFKDVSVTIWLDTQVVYQKDLHGETKSRAVLFRQVQGHQSDSIPVASGKHQLRIHAQTPDNGFDQSKTITAMFEESGETVLHVRCAKQGGQMDVTVQ